MYQYNIYFYIVEMILLSLAIDNVLSGEINMMNSVADYEVGGVVHAGAFPFEQMSDAQSSKKEETGNAKNIAERDILWTLIQRKNKLDKEIGRKPNAKVIKRSTLAERISSFFAKAFT